MILRNKLSDAALLIVLITLLVSKGAFGGVIMETRIWKENGRPRTRIPYEIAGSFDTTSKQAIQDAVENIWNRAMPVKLFPRTGKEIDYISFQLPPRSFEGGGFAEPGFKNGKNNIFINAPFATTDEVKRLVLHEIGHALGLHHELRHCRRGMFVEVKEENVRKFLGNTVVRRNYGRVSCAVESNRIGDRSLFLDENKTKPDYSFASIMHDPKDIVLVIGGKLVPTILWESTKTDGAALLKAEGITEEQVGSRAFISESDVRAIKTLYKIN